MIALVGRPGNSGCIGSDKKKASPRTAGQDPAPCIHESLGKPNPIARPALDPLGALSGSVTPSPRRPSGAQFESRSIPQKVAETTSQSVNVEVPGSQTSEPGPSQSVSQSNKYLKTGPKTRCPAGLAAGGDRPRWLRGLERYFGRAEGGAWPEQNRMWMERERDRRVRRKLPSTPHTKKRKPGQAPAGPALG